MSTDYRAIVLDLDGTLVADDGTIHPRTRSALQRIHERGIRVMVATGRSEGAAKPVVDELGFGVPTVVYNGAAVYCSTEGRVIEQVCLDAAEFDRVLQYSRDQNCLVVASNDGTKVGFSPPHIDGSIELHDMTKVRFVDDASELRLDGVIRVSLFSNEHDGAGTFATHFQEQVPGDFYVTDFPLHLLPAYRQSRLMVLDVHPPCPGKARALELLDERYGISAEQTVAVGDATNDLPMLERAGLGVAMKGSMPQVLEVADRVIGENHTDTIAELVEDLFR